MVNPHEDSDESSSQAGFMWLFLLICLIATAGFIFVNNDAFSKAKQRYVLITEGLQNLYETTAIKDGFTLDKVIIEGAVRTNNDKLEEAIALVPGQILTDIDILTIQNRVKELPWVEKVVVQRIFPDAIVVNVSEHRPIALWQNGAEYSVITAKGKVLDARAQILNTDDLPLIVGEGAPEKTPELLLALAKNAEVSNRFKAAVLVGGRRWDLLLDNIDAPLLIRLPEHTETAALDRLKNLQEKYAILKRKLTLIDLRLRERLTVRL